MIISVTVKANARTEKIESTGERELRVWVKEPRHENKANLAVLRAVARHYRVPIRSVSIKSGHTSSRKIIEIAGIAQIPGKTPGA